MHAIDTIGATHGRATTHVSPLRIAPAERIRLRRHLTLLRRDEGHLQLGFDSVDATVIADPDGALTALLEVMDGRFRFTELTVVAEQLGLRSTDLDALVTTLAEADLLQPTDESGLPASSVRLVGLGAVGTRIGEQLLAAGLGRLLVVDPYERTPWGGWTSGRERVHRAEHWSEPQIGAVAVTVVVASGLEVDRAVTTALTQEDHPHLLVRPRDRGAVVGPFVLPGRTSCLRCGDLARTRTDTAWPRILAQLCRVPGEWHPLAADWAAALATTQVLAHLAGRTPETAAATLELGPVDWSWQRRVWPADPACGCCWSPRAEW